MCISLAIAMIIFPNFIIREDASARPEMRLWLYDVSN